MEIARAKHTAHPILFSGEMVRAILSGRKTQTRRVVKPQTMDWQTLRWPYGKAGDRLWVRETFTLTQHGDPVYRADGRDKTGEQWDIAPDDPGREVKWRPSIFMPRNASRITLEITDIRMEKLQDMTEEDAEKEGFDGIDDLLDPFDRVFVVGFISTWNRLNVKRGYGWDVNPWVWVISFKLIGSLGYV